MGSFTWEVDGERVEIIFSLIRNARWLDDDHDAVCFDFRDHEDICVMAIDLDLENSEYGRDLWQMLLQVTNLDAT
jgi:hypothetical protein